MPAIGVAAPANVLNPAIEAQCRLMARWFCQPAAVWLAAYAFTQNARRVNLLGEQIESGMLAISSFTIAAPEAPFGGVKESGHGSEEGIEGLDSCLVTKFITES